MKFELFFIRVGNFFNKEILVKKKENWKKNFFVDLKKFEIKEKVIYEYLMFLMQLFKNFIFWVFEKNNKKKEIENINLEINNEFPHLEDIKYFLKKCHISNFNNFMDIITKNEFCEKKKNDINNNKKKKKLLRLKNLITQYIPDIKNILFYIYRINWQILKNDINLKKKEIKNVNFLKPVYTLLLNSKKNSKTDFKNLSKSELISIKDFSFIIKYILKNINSLYFLRKDFPSIIEEILINNQLYIIDSYSCLNQIKNLSDNYIKYLFLKLKVE